MTIPRSIATTTLLVLLVVSLGCSSNSGAGVDRADEATAASGGGGDDGGASGGSGATLVLDGETLTAKGALCHLEAQDVSGGDGKMLATAMATFEDASGNRVHLDFTRYDADSRFHGDDVTIDVGELGEDLDADARKSFDEGTVAIDGRKVSASELELVRSDGGTSIVSFDLAC